MSFAKISEYWYNALSTDVKTTVGITKGAKLIETDTDANFIFTAAGAWVEIENVVISAEHKRVHNGEMWDITALYIDVANDAFADLAVEVGDDELHCVYQGSSEGNARVFVHEAPNTSAGSTGLIKNANRVRGDGSPPATIVNSPTVSAVGTKLTEGCISGGRGGNAAGGGIERGTEIILAPSTKYLFRMKNTKGSDADMCWALHVYQHTH